MKGLGKGREGREERKEGKPSAYVIIILFNLFFLQINTLCYTL